MSDRLLVPVNFIIPDPTRLPAIRALRPEEMTDAAILEHMSMLGQNWVVQTYARLAHAGEDVTLGIEPLPGAVNVFEPVSFGFRAWRPDCFFVAARGDAYRSRLADHWIEQNEARPVGPHQSRINFWMQNGLIPRDPARGTRIETLHFKGPPQNLDAVYTNDKFRAALESRGVALIAPGARAVATSGSALRDFYRDYRHADLVLGIRNMTRNDALGKPANKMLNAWSAGVPAILGPEPAFQSLRRSPLDYVEVRTPDDVLAAIDRLQAEPGIYAAMVRNGRERVEDYDHASTLARWIGLFNGPVRADWDRWKRRPALLRRLSAPGRYVGDRLARRHYRWRARNGPRIID